MKLVLNSRNVFKYLIDKGLFKQSEEPPYKIEPITGKNFNLLLTFKNEHKLLVKQERFNKEGSISSELISEVKFQQFLKQFPELNKFRDFLVDIVFFDIENSIIVFKYLENYFDLINFYSEEKDFPIKIAVEIGNILGTIHLNTFKNQEYHNFFTKNYTYYNPISHLIKYLEKIEPEIFGLIPDDGLKFFVLYQRYDSLMQAINELKYAVTPSCLTHNDFKLNNILLKKTWANSNNNIRLIDWERSNWGDPAFDLGTIIASYIRLWLSSLVISSSLTIEESLRLAVTPLELLQPSISSLTLAYLKTFPKILKYRPDFLRRVIQFTGFTLIQQILAMIQHEKHFNNTGIVMLQVSKSLLTRPIESISTIFGAATFELKEFEKSNI